MAVPGEVQILFGGVDFGGRRSHDRLDQLQLGARVLDGAGAEMTLRICRTVHVTATRRCDRRYRGDREAHRRAGSTMIFAHSPSRRRVRDSVAMTLSATGARALRLTSDRRFVNGAAPSVVSNWRVRDVAGTFADSGLALISSSVSASQPARLRASASRRPVIAPGLRTTWS